MKEKGGHFIRASAIALAVHALLFLVVAQLIRGNLTTNAGVGLVEIQLSGDGAGGGAGGGGGTGPAGKSTHGLQHALQASPTPTPARATPPAQAPARAPVRTPSPAPPPLPSVSSPAQSPVEAATTNTPSSAPLENWPAVSGPADGGAPGGAGASGDGQSGGSASGPMGDLPATIADIDPVPLQPIAAPYPPRARRLGQQGLVKIRAEIDDQGIVVAAQISVSSGFGDLDNAALDAVKNARFLPAKKNGRSVASIFVKPIRFRLQQGQSFSSQE